MMLFQNLVERYEQVIGTRFEIVETDDDNVSEESPAAVMPDGRVLLWKHIKRCNREEALAHEMMHKILNKEMLSSFVPNEMRVKQINGWEEIEFSDDIKYIIAKLDILTREINNALSHKRLICEIKCQYGIDSKKHLHDRLGVFETYKEWIAHEFCSIEALHAVGLMLYDVEHTITGVSEKVLVAIKENNEVFRSYSSANKYLLRITAGVDVGKQHEAVKSFLKDLNYDENILAIHPS